MLFDSGQVNYKSPAMLKNGYIYDKMTYLTLPVCQNDIILFFYIGANTEKASYLCAFKANRLIQRLWQTDSWIPSAG